MSCASKNMKKPRACCGCERRALCHRATNHAAADGEQAAPSAIETVSAPTRRNKRENLEGLY